jgi:hypothetical protein
MRDYENGLNTSSERSGGKWEDDPLSYAYNKQMSSRAAQMLAKGNECIEKHKMEYWDIRKLASEFFKTRY